MEEGYLIRVSLAKIWRWCEKRTFKFKLVASYTLTTLFGWVIQLELLGVLVESKYEVVWREIKYIKWVINTVTF